MEVDKKAIYKAEPSADPPFSLTSLWFGSSVYIQAARGDVDRLLDAFATQWTECGKLAGEGEAVEAGSVVAPTSGEEGGDATTPAANKRTSLNGQGGGAGRSTTTRPGVTESGPSAFAVFKQCWLGLGWDKVHISVVGAILRAEWFKIMTRLFLERLEPELPNDLRKAGALLALYTFWASQPTTSEQHYVRIDPPTMTVIIQLPEVLADVVDRSAPPPEADALVSLRASDDLVMALQLLLHGPQGSAFFLIPTIPFRHPELPSSRLGTEKDLPAPVGAPAPRSVSPPAAKRPRPSAQNPTHSGRLVHPHASTSTSQEPTYPWMVPHPPAGNIPPRHPHPHDAGPSAGMDVDLPQPYWANGLGHRPNGQPQLSAQDIQYFLRNVEQMHERGGGSGGGQSASSAGNGHHDGGGANVLPAMVGPPGDHHLDMTPGSLLDVAALARASGGTVGNGADVEGHDWNSFLRDAHDDDAQAADYHASLLQRHASQGGGS